MAEDPLPPDDAIVSTFIEEHYLQEQKNHQERPCNWCQGEKKGSFDCAGAPAIKSGAFWAVQWYNEAPPRRYSDPEIPE